jgi:hypothetical protein
VGSRRRTLATPFIHRLAAQPSLVVPPVVSAGDLTMPPELFASDGSALGTTSVAGVGAGCARGADVVGAGGADTVGVGGANTVGAEAPMTQVLDGSGATLL